MTQYHFDPATYLENIKADIPGFDAFQERVAEATRGIGARRILELGVGTGETAARVLAIHPDAAFVGIDSSELMLSLARERVGGKLHVSSLEDELPAGPFDLVVAALSVHHLDGAGKRELFRRISEVLRPGGRFVLGDVVVPEELSDATIPLTPEFDLPDTAAEQLAWLRDAGLEPELVWTDRDLAVLTADLLDGFPSAGAGTPPSS